VPAKIRKRKKNKGDFRAQEGLAFERSTTIPPLGETEAEAEDMHLPVGKCVDLITIFTKYEMRPGSMAHDIISAT
jgi:hypothetical protein